MDKKWTPQDEPDEAAADKADDDNEQPSHLESDALYKQLREWYDVDFGHSSEWRKNAKIDFDFTAGNQWDDKDRRALEDQRRPVITFNRTLAIVKAVAGVEINSRHETVYLPRGTEPGQVRANEILTAASQWMSDGCDAEDEQSEAFQDATICGMGWTEPRIGYDEEPDGKYVEQKIDPLEMVWDHAARAKNLSDARRVYRVRKMTLDEARDLARSIGADDCDDSDLNATWAIGASDDKDAKPVEERHLRLENSGPLDPKSEVHIIQAQWIERETYYRVADQSGKLNSLDAKQFAALNRAAADAGIQVTFVKQTRKVYKQAFLGGKVLGDVRPCPGGDRFTFSCITGERDRNKGTWFGLVKLMRDPQMWANKWLSQTLHILNTTAKGGIIAEEDAFADMRSAQDTYAQPDSITWAAKDAISKGKIMQKPGTGIPTGYINLLEFAISSIRDVTGINMELLGLRDANQPGILEAQRKQAAMTILATLFDSLRRFRKNVGRVRLHFIQEYLADGRLIRVAGQEGMQFVPLLRDQTLGDYEVIVEDAPTSPNQKEQTWATLQMILPAFRSMMTPEAVITILEYSPLPSKLVAAFRSMLAKPNPQAEQAQSVGMAAQMAKVDKDRASAERDHAAALSERIDAVLKLAEAGVAAMQSAPQMPMPQQPVSPILPDSEPFAVPPIQGGGQQMRTVPQVPVIPAGVTLPTLNGGGG